MASYTEQQRAQAKQRQAAAQAQVQRRLQSGGGINLYSANPLEAAVQGIGSFFGITKPPTAYAAQTQGQNRLVVPGGWSDRSNMPGNVNVAGRTWNLAQQGSNAVYIPQGTTTPLNAIVRGAGSAPPAPALPPSSSSSPAADRAYQQEASRVAQLTAQDPELQRYEKARQDAVAKGATPETVQSAEDIGMQIWAAKYGPGSKNDLASKVKPGQAGYEAIQSQLGAGQMGSPMELGAFANAQPTDLLFNPSSPLGAPPRTGPTDYTQVVPAALGGTLGIGGSYFNSPQQAQLFSRFQQAAPAQTGMNPGLAPGSPYAEAAAAGGASYAGATGIQPVGSSLTQGADSFASQKAQQQAEEFKKRLLSVQQ